MDKRSLIAIVLSAIVIFSYPYIIKRFYPPKKGAVEKTSTTTVKKTSSGESRPSSPQPSQLEGSAAGPQGTEGQSEPPQVGRATEKRPLTENLIQVDTPLYRAVISTIGGGVKSWQLKKYHKTADKSSGPVDLVAVPDETPTLLTRVVYGTTVETAELTSALKSMVLEDNDNKELVLRGRTTNGLSIEKRYLFKGSDYLVKTELRIANTAGTPFNGFVDTLLVRGLEKPKKKKSSRASYHKGGVISIGEHIIRHKDKDPSETRTANVKWIGIEDKYFLSALIPLTKIPVSWTLAPPTKGKLEVFDAGTRFAIKLGPGETALYSYNTFMGPKKYDLLVREKNGLEDSVEFGYFAVMAKPLLSVLNFFQRFVVNYGIAIIILTVLIKIIFYPLTHHGLKSMQGMKRVQPQLVAIKEKYKDDKARLNKEIMALYKKYKINPVGGCLPMFLQIPVFIALYEVLYACIELRHAPFFLWIHDLSAQDPYYITPLIMGGSMFLQQKMTPTSVDPTQAKMMLFMPVIFTVMFLKFPAGLVIYWLVNNLLSIAQQYYINRTDTAKA